TKRGGRSCSRSYASNTSNGDGNTTPPRSKMTARKAGARSAVSLTGGTVAEAPRALRPGCDDAGGMDDPGPVGDATEKIRALVAAYGERLDAGDLDGVAALFANATWRSGTRSLTGVSAIRAVYDDVILYDGVPST